MQTDESNFFPKGEGFSRISVDEIKMVQKTLNAPPRKALNFHKPTQPNTIFLNKKLLKGHAGLQNFKF